MDFAHANNPLLLKRALRRDRAIVGVALLILILFAWLYVLRLAAGRSSHVHDVRQLCWDIVWIGWDLCDVRVLLEAFNLLAVARLVHRSATGTCKCWRWKVYGGLGKYLMPAATRSKDRELIIAALLILTPAAHGGVSDRNELQEECTGSECIPGCMGC
jgi:hypothetical protein